MASSSLLAAPASLDQFNVAWTTPSRDASGSMPLGNGEVAVNAWVEEGSGDLLLLIGRSDAYSEISRLLKVGRVRIKMDPSPFGPGQGGFRQELILRQGTIRLEGDGESLSLFVDSEADVIHLTGSLKKPRRVALEVESWRLQPRTLSQEEGVSAWSVNGAPFPLIEAADLFEEKEDRITWSHRNEATVVPQLASLQGLTGLAGLRDPLLHRTFGGEARGAGLVRTRERTLASPGPIREVALTIATHSAQTKTREEWRDALQVQPRDPAAALNRTRKWWGAYWDRSWVIPSAPPQGQPVPEFKHPLRIGFDSNQENRFSGEIHRTAVSTQFLAAGELRRLLDDPDRSFSRKGQSAGLSLSAEVTLKEEKPGRIFDRLTAGQEDGFLFDTHPGRSLRLIVGGLTLSAPNVLTLGRKHWVAAAYNPADGEASIWLDGERVAHRPPQSGQAIAHAWILQRYMQGVQARGSLPVKFNGGTLTVEPKAMGMAHNPDWRRWGDAHWFQNVRHIYHPMLASGDWEMMEPFFRLYEEAAPLAASRTQSYHQAQGVYFPETMTIFGTYAGGDYGWDRTGLKPSDVQCVWWRWAWNQGPELIGLMLDRWDMTRDEAFLTSRLLPLAESVLQYFDTRFSKDVHGKIILDPTQVVETYWEGVRNDLPTVAGLLSITDRLTKLPSSLVPAEKARFFAKMQKACPDLPFDMRNGKRSLAPAHAYIPKITNVENAELYAVWPFRLATLGRPGLLPEAKTAYETRKNRLDNGWGYDGNAAALMGLTDEAARIMRSKASNSHPAYRWPATWGPNFDWLPDQNHGGNLLNTLQLMALQAESLEEGGAIRLFPSWPQDWDCDLQLWAPGKTRIRARLVQGKLEALEVAPASRKKDVILPAWLKGSSR